MSFIQTNVPLVFWGQRPPTHEITCICRSEEKKGIATASRSGQICIWDVCRERETEKVRLRPRCLLFGRHHSAISLCFIKNWSGDRDRIGSLSEKGLLSLWDGKGGICLKYVQIPGHHTAIKPLLRSKYSETLIVLYGQYSNVYILDSNTLETVCTLKAYHNPNWITQVCFIADMEQKDALLALTVDGAAKFWLLPSRSEMREQEVIYEEKSQTLGFTNPLSLTSHFYNGHSTALVVCKDSWLLFDATSGHIKQLLIHGCEHAVTSWTGGDFVDHRTIVIWAKEDGKAFVYKLSPRCVPGMKGGLEDSIDTSTAGCSIQYILSPTSPPPHPPLSTYLDKYWHIQGDRNGRLYLWDVRRIRDEVPPSSNEPIPPDTSSCISDSWESPAMPCGLTDMLFPNDAPPPTISCALYLASFGRLVCGQTDGCIAVLSASQAATVLMLQPRKFSQGWPQYCIMKGHKGRVNTLLHPSAHSRVYDNNDLVSGGADFTVKLWDLYSGVLVHTFAVHGGEVKSIVSCPPEINPRLQTCVCSIAEDYSVALLSLTERKCLLVAACHSSPVECVRWRLVEDFLLVSCVDGKLYVWQIETGSLDRCVEGETAQIILNNSPLSSPAPSPSSSTPPLQVCSLRAGEKDPMIQVLLFDPQTLITRLTKMEVEKAPKHRKPKQVDAFKTYLYARRHFGSGVAPPPPTGRTPQQRGSIAGSLTSSLDSSDPGRFQEKAREVLGQAVASQTKVEQLKEEAPGTIVDIIRLLLSCLHAWNLDPSLDALCERVLGLVRPFRPVSFGLLSRGGCICLVLPGWGLRIRTHFETQNSEIGNIVSGSDTADDKMALFSQQSTPDGVASSPESKWTSTVPIFDQKYHIRWQLSRSLTTQHLLTMVSITNTLMNRSVGAHALASSSGVWKGLSEDLEDSDSDSEEVQTSRDNQIRAVWSQALHIQMTTSEERFKQDGGLKVPGCWTTVMRRQGGRSNPHRPLTSNDVQNVSKLFPELKLVTYNLFIKVAALHCVMLPERMEGKFRPPHLPVLASRFLDACQAIREAAQALLQAELRRIGPEGRKQLVQEWVSKLQSPASFKTSSDRSKPRFVEETDGGEGPVPTQQQQTTALIILGMIGAEFSSDIDKAQQMRKKSDHGRGGKRMSGQGIDLENMDPVIAGQTAKTLQAVLLEKPGSKASLHSNLRCSAAELIGRGFHLWEKYIDIPQVVMGLLDLVVQYSPVAVGKEESKKSSSSKSIKFASEIARRALNLMILVRPVTMVTTLAKEVATFLASQHVTHFPHSSLPPIQVGMTPPPSTAGIVTQPNALLPSVKSELLDLMKTVIEKCSQQISLQLLEIVDTVLFCLEQDQLKKKNLFELFPAISRISNISYSIKSKRLAVGARSGQVGIYDLKQGRTQMLNAHTHPVTVLMFSEDGKLLATYAYGDSTLSVWQLGSSLFGGVINQTPKLVNSWPAISSSSIVTYTNFIRLEWSGTRSIILFMPGGVECKYSL